MHISLISIVGIFFFIISRHYLPTHPVLPEPASLTYKDVPYLTFLKFAEEYARSQGWAMHGYPGNPDGEKSPDWNYQANNGTGGLATTNPTWEPHNPLPW